MKQTLDRADFIRAFKDYGRENNFSYWGLNQLWDYFEELERDTDVEMELDVIAICCDFNESSWDEFKSDYPDYADMEDVDELVGKLRDHTVVVAWDDNNILYQAF